MNQELVVQQYEIDSLQARVDMALTRAGLSNGVIRWPELAPLDQFHIRGLAGSKELAEAVGFREGSEVLDVGCGLGGPARFLAATYGCRVTGIDLSPSFVDVATTLTDRCGLSEGVSFRCADALSLPFEEASFDDAWTQHVAMNIADRLTFYTEIRRVLKPDGRLAILDVVAGNGHPLHFPVPWANQPELSFLLTADSMREVLRRAGFAEVSWDDKTEASLSWFGELQCRMRSSPPLSMAIIMGPRFREKVENLGRNLQEGRIRLVQAVFRRA
ncbi:MAG: class I SAM-dependent methyltransferase [Isosphaeraceae bacterium]